MSWRALQVGLCLIVAALFNQAVVLPAPPAGVQAITPTSGAMDRPADFKSSGSAAANWTPVRLVIPSIKLNAAIEDEKFEMPPPKK